MNKHALRWGLLVGGALILIKLLLYFTSSTGMNSNFLTCTAFIPYLFGMYMAAKDQREEQGGWISFWQAFRVAWVVVLLGSLMTLIFNFLIFYVVNPDLLVSMKEQMMTQLETMDMEIPEEASDMMDTNFGAIFKFSLIFTFVLFGVIVGFVGSLIVASAVEKSSTQEDEFPTL